jgi:hypothetical protein
MDPDETDNEIDIDIDEVEADAEDDDELDEDDEDCGSIENDENHQYHNNGYGNKQQNISHLKRRKLDLTNGSINNKLTKKIFNIKNELYINNNNNKTSANISSNMSEFNQQRKVGKGFGFTKNDSMARLSKNGHSNPVKSSKKFSVKSESDMVRNNVQSNGSYYMVGNSLNYDDGSNHSSRILIFINFRKERVFFTFKLLTAKVYTKRMRIFIFYLVL